MYRVKTVSQVLCHFDVGGRGRGKLVYTMSKSRVSNNIEMIQLPIVRMIIRMLYQAFNYETPCTIVHGETKLKNGKTIVPVLGYIAWTTLLR